MSMESFVDYLLVESVYTGCGFIHSLKQRVCVTGIDKNHEFLFYSFCSCLLMYRCLKNANRGRPHRIPVFVSVSRLEAKWSCTRKDIQYLLDLQKAKGFHPGRSGNCACLIARSLWLQDFSLFPSSVQKPTLYDCCDWLSSPVCSAENKSWILSRNFCLLKVSAVCLYGIDLLCLLSDENNIRFCFCTSKEQIPFSR